ncbi:hypothetical protein BC830DRAFT_1153272 [Chytriomyces sp. MP71]|nr:hypothetical protein BC830DRAFT_1153272 [Chytriomyces sp. MP71]
MTLRTKNFSSQSFWDARFETEECFEWLADTPLLTDKCASALSLPLRGARADPTSTRVLHIGCGTSRLANALRLKLCASEDGGVGMAACDIVNLDYSSRAVERGEKAEEAQFGDVQMAWVVANLLDWDSLHGCLAEGALFRIILDKSTADAISCGANVTVSINSQQVDVEPVAALALHMARVAEPGAAWIVLSYSKSRFDFLNDEGDHAGTSAFAKCSITKLWKLVEQVDVKVEDSAEKKDFVHAPEVFHSLMVLERTDFHI